MLLKWKPELLHLSIGKVLAMRGLVPTSVLVCCLCATLSSQTQEDAVMTSMDHYVSSFQARDLDGVLASWDLPAEIIYEDLHATFATRDDLAAFYDQALTALPPDYGHSELDKISVKLLSERIALVGWEFGRYRRSGEEYFRAAAMYKLKRTESGWKMISMLTYDSDAYVAF